ncbi:MAG: DUF1365 domain-containing protein [Pseudomonadota bacterium]|nr:DUF1365 domain-containing protein [Pseudomonadota bacterium]
MKALRNRAALPRALLGTGTVRHHRLRPRDHAFAYPTYFLMLPLRALRAQPDPTLRRNRFGLLGFNDADHGSGGPDALAWLEQLLVGEGIHDATGEVWLHTYPRVLGYVFKPVSFWYCHRADDSLSAVVVEVNNTFGERHCYLLSGSGVAFGRELSAAKVFHVSPFCQVQGDYRFRFMRAGTGGDDRTVARVDHHDADGALLQTSVSGRLAPLTAQAVRRAFFGMPLMTLGVMWRIHWQALKLWRKGVPFVRKPAPPGTFVSR